MGKNVMYPYWDVELNQDMKQGEWTVGGSWKKRSANFCMSKDGRRQLVKKSLEGKGKSAKRRNVK